MVCVCVCVFCCGFDSPLQQATARVKVLEQSQVRDLPLLSEFSTFCLSCQIDYPNSPGRLVRKQKRPQEAATLNAAVRSAPRRGLSDFPSFPGNLVAIIAPQDGFEIADADLSHGGPRGDPRDAAERLGGLRGPPGHEVRHRPPPALNILMMLWGVSI